MIDLLALSLLLSAPPQVGDAAAEFLLQTVGGEQVELSELTDGGPVVLVVLRGFPGYQCPLCTRQAGDFLGRADEFAAAKATVVFVYPADATLGVEGTRKKATEFLHGTKLPDNVQLVLDPGYELTEGYGLRWNAPNETAYPSTFVIDADGVVRHAVVSESHGGRTNAADTLAVVKSLN